MSAVFVVDVRIAAAALCESLFYQNEPPTRIVAFRTIELEISIFVERNQSVDRDWHSDATIIKNDARCTNLDGVAQLHRKKVLFENAFPFGNRRHRSDQIAIGDVALDEVPVLRIVEHFALKVLFRANPQSRFDEFLEFWLRNHVFLFWEETFINELGVVGQTTLNNLPIIEK